MSSRYDGVSHVVHVTSGARVGCEHCDSWPADRRFDQSVNHYIGEHDYRLLHVGCEWAAERTGMEAIAHTVAVLGR